MGQGSASRLTDQHPDKSHHEIRLYASYKAENWSIHIKTITCNVWNHSKPFKIACNMSFNTKNIAKSSKISTNHKNKFLQYLSTRIFTEKKNLIRFIFEKSFGIATRIISVGWKHSNFILIFQFHVLSLRLSSFSGAFALVAVFFFGGRV